ncbi:thiamine pyrophosphate-dependent enzyme [Youngiibacter fragilis]|uniref:Thiamine pyrophosphate enzyme-like protein n=1 Tax=Youngiibacter fragilis 232.1 TaxID=994573 RepID=V7I2T5_9CLOT|nr:thiamine pyrophosphate-dependent enzyme [Youngiibacter fragilis]ETA79504.1 thiamine pyrophosphate enzyme-like protein [Youngiibacter fragilis 232.1]
MTIAEKIASMEDMVGPGITACLGCNVELSMRTALQVMGPNTILAIPPGCMGGVQSVGWADKTGMKIPVFFPLLDNTASMLSGIKKYYERIDRDVNVVAFAGDGASLDAGFQALSGAAERGDNIIYICYDNEGYMNTGFQRSSSTSLGSWTSTTPVGKVGQGKKSNKKDMPLIMAMHDIPYMATASPAYMPDLIRKLEKAKTIKEGLVYIHIYNSCATGWGYDSEKSIEIARKGVQSRFMPIYEVENGKFKLNVDVKNPLPLKDYLSSMKKYKHVSEEQIAELQEYIDKKWENLKTLCSSMG